MEHPDNCESGMVMDNVSVSGKSPKDLKIVAIIIFNSFDSLRFRTQASVTPYTKRNCYTGDKQLAVCCLI